MAIGEDTISLLISQKRVWNRLIEFQRWDEWLKLPEAEDKGLGNSMRCLGGEGTDMKFGLYCGETLMQTMRATQWNPPQGLAIALEGWDWKTASIQRKGKPLPENQARSIGMLKAIELSLSVELTKVEDVETKLRFAIEARFTHPLMGILLNTFYPMRGALQKIAVKFTSRFVESFETAGKGSNPIDRASPLAEPTPAAEPGPNDKPPPRKGLRNW